MIDSEALQTFTASVQQTNVEQQVSEEKKLRKELKLKKIIRKRKIHAVILSFAFLLSLTITIFSLILPKFFLHSNSNSIRPSVNSLIFEENIGLYSSCMKININKEVLTLRSPHCVDMFSLFCNSNFKYTQFKSTAELNATTFRQFVLEHSLAKNCDALFRMAAKTTMEYHNLHHSPQQINQQLHITSNVRQLSLIEIEQLKLQKEQLELELQLQSNLQNQDNLKSINLKVLQLQQQQQQQLQSFNNLGDYNATRSGHGNISPLGSPLPAFSCASPINDFNMSEFQEEASFEVNNNSFINTTSTSKKKVKRQSLVRQNSIVDEDNK
ncbi:hypothetical protein HK099_005255 [Clydaea vesicula]|uniref:Transmembrane protein n=1 Tax=Clydaea vesicula TaxID=447962 RepID=A0AAD5UC61_9FUNG|nr:hypothetical protein HK099_005255 [Clydaea vesicula]